MEDSGFENVYNPLCKNGTSYLSANRQKYLNEALYF